MKIKLLILLTIIVSFFIIADSTHAQEDVNTKASVGRFYFSASGIVSPYASVVLYSQDYFLSSTVADGEGNFTLPEALVNDGFNSFCLEAIDIKKIGTSYTCFEVETPRSDFSRDDIFLPPTVGLSGRKIEPNSSITASGYSMPKSTIDVKLGEGFWVEASSDENGYYETKLESGVPPGKYELYATAVYGAQISEKPTRTFTVEVLGTKRNFKLWQIVLLVLILILIFIFIPLIILFVKKRKRKGQKKPVKKPSKKPSFIQKLLFWRA